MRTFECTEAWLRETADEIEKAGNKWSAGLTAADCRALADRLAQLGSPDAPLDEPAAKPA